MDAQTTSVRSAADQPLATYLEALASAAPAPGGGSATALAGALAAALVSMVGNLTVGKRRYAAVEPQMRQIVETAGRQRAELLRLMHEDEQAFGALSAAYRLPRGTEAERAARSAAIQQALHGAAQAPLAMAERCRQLLDLTRPVAESGNRNLASDAGVAALLAEAALRASAINVRVNLAMLEDAAFVAQTEGRLNDLLEGTPRQVEAILAVVGERMLGG